ncbi:MAG: DNA recombination protein RmuC [Anaerolineae bacterium]|nr:DNA recombination protein RmuC [Anaerolineae bacterium]
MMDGLLFVVVFVLGVLLGLGLAFGLRIVQARTAESLAQDLFRETEKRRKADEAQLLETVKNNFGRLTLEAQKRSHDVFLTLAEQRLEKQTAQHTAELESKKDLIGQHLGQVETQLRRVSDLVSEFEEKRAEKIGALSSELQQLIQTSSSLQQALADNRARGQWGERIADDILRLAGFVEGVNYGRQMTTNVDGQKSRPDFTFFLPKAMTLNMDVKFPLDNYMAFLNAESPADQDSYCRKFLSDVRSHIKAVSSREYINLENNTADCVLLFIPNEQIYRFIHEQDFSLVDNALEQKVILCSPLTLYIVLAVIRQAADNFALEQSSREVLILLKKFKKQWEAFNQKMDALGSSLEKTQAAYEDLTGRRKKALERPLGEVDKLVSRYNILVPEETLVED